MTYLREAGEVSTGGLLDGRYRLEERIGDGGSARVYRAEDTLLGREVAVKVLHGTLEGLGTVERARSETTLLASLNHHALVTLLDAHVADGEVSYLVMEHVDGITLRERMQQGPMNPREVAEIAVDIAEGLHVAHEAGIVHRDIKPSNILLWSSPLPGREWRAKIADFGIACLLDAERLTTPGLLVGTMAYIAPEQARGEAPAPPIDIYSFGIMLIEALTGSRPYSDAEGIGTVMARLAGPPEIPTTLHPAWQGLLRGMTANLPSDRPTALEVAVTAQRLASISTPPVPSTTDLTTVATPVVGAAPPTATLVMPAPATDAPLPVSASVAVRRPRRRKEPVGGAGDRRRTIVVLAIAIAVLAASIGLVLWAAAAAATPEPVPALIAPVEQEKAVVPAQEETTVTEPDAVVPDPVQVADQGGTVTTDKEAGPDKTKGSGPGSDKGNGPDSNSGKGKGSSK